MSPSPLLQNPQALCFHVPAAKGGNSASDTRSPAARPPFQGWLCVVGGLDGAGGSSLAAPEKMGELGACKTRRSSWAGQLPPAGHCRATGQDAPAEGNGQDSENAQ